MFATALYLASYLCVLNVNPAALVGAITAGFEMVRLIVFYVIEKREKFNTKINNLFAMITFSIILTVCTVVAWGTWIRIFPLVSAIIVSLALGSKNVVVIKIAFIIQAVFITTYLFLLSLWINAASQVFVFVFGIVGLITDLQKNKKNKTQTDQ